MLFHSFDNAKTRPRNLKYICTVNGINFRTEANLSKRGEKDGKVGLDAGISN